MGSGWGDVGGGGVGAEEPDKLPMDLCRVINYHPGKGPGQSPPVKKTHRQTLVFLIRVCLGEMLKKDFAF